MITNITSSGIPSCPFLSLPRDIMLAHILSHLEEKDLRVMEAMSRAFRDLANIVREARYGAEGFFPKDLPSGVTYKDFLFRRFPNRVGVDVYRKHLGEVGVIPVVPKHLIEMAPLPDCKLVFIPEYITITVDKDSPLMLDETNAGNGKQARLIEDPARASEEQAKGQVREIKVPVTLNNIVLLVQKYLKKHNSTSQFEGIDEKSWKNILSQNGDIGVGAPHWSYQKEAPLGPAYPYDSSLDEGKGQLEIAQLEVVPLVDRILFHLSSYIKSGKLPQSNCFERTSTIVVDSNARSWESTIWWPASGPVFRLFLRIGYDGSDSVGVAARAPAESSQAIGD